MKKIAILIFMAVISTAMVFAQINDFPDLDVGYVYLMEINGGIEIGQNNHGVPVNARITYLIYNWGFIFEGGAVFRENLMVETSFLLGASYTVFENEKMRIPVNFGITYQLNKDGYFGFSTGISYHYFLHKNLYIGVNLGINAYFIRSYKEYELALCKHGEIQMSSPCCEHGEARPIYNMVDRKEYGFWLNFRPSLVIGFQI